MSPLEQFIEMAEIADKTLSQLPDEIAILYGPSRKILQDLIDREMKKPKEEPKPQPWTPRW